MNTQEPLNKSVSTFPLQDEYTPQALEADLLLQRIKAGGDSGQLLADAFISCYRPDTTFKHSLGEVNRLDHEAAQLFHQIIDIRTVEGWSDEGLYEIEQAILDIIGGRS